MRLPSLFKTQLSSNWLPAAFAPAGYLVWRLFIFKNERSATDVGYQLSQIFKSPTYAFEQILQLAGDTIKVILTAWIEPFNNLVLNLTWGQMLVGAVLAVISAFCAAWLLKRLKPTGVENSANTWNKQGAIIGLLAASLALVPIILANRMVEFTYFSRYALASAIGAAMLAAACLDWINNIRLQRICAAVLVGCAVMTHYANGVKAAAETAEINQFWWQVSWRVPQIEPTTLLAAEYPTISLEEDYFVWGPAAQIYYPEGEVNDTDNLQTVVSAILLTPGNIDKQMFVKGWQKTFRRGITSKLSFEDLMLLTQPTPQSCVRVIDGSNPELSTHDSDAVKLLAPYSVLKRVMPEEEAARPPEMIFGTEPPQTWCYYFEKADLARQKNDWAKVIALWDEAFAKGFYPADPVELLPFMEASQQMGDDAHIRQILDGLKTHFNPSSERTCINLHNLLKDNETIWAEIRSDYCPIP